MDNLTLALDAMGGDFGPQVTVPASMQALERFPHLSISLFGDQNVITKYIPDSFAFHDRLTLEHCTEIVTMNDRPLTAVRNRRESSMRKAIDMVQQGNASACVSAGNTGVLMAMAKLVLKTLPGIDRPALVSVLPSLNDKSVYMLDLGANVSCDSETLLQFAVMGSVMAEKVDKISQPRISLLNVGEEAIKGNDVVKQTAELLKQTAQLNYIGFIEGDQIFNGQTDVIVCDGFVGNISLKTTEGVANLLIEHLQQASKSNWSMRVLSLIAKPFLKKVLCKMKPDQYNGASLLGLRGIVIKSHGNADQQAFFNAIKQAISEVEQQVPSRIQDSLESILLEKIC
ncbi:phosphate acyltransferase PlsX [Psychrobium sp. 1_MG-2023]|uniref:phosphate acyltransferase PlsX n=1 Tax=Psychrobium sp. 1_MG-2023 TaxID=3062624 RepID=UPI000C347ED9|nr:phosphate acyltransferase PlsX [Psychrobium sp. 1_MG-2023]MDP2562316.1 phosphate acyltransferase PlsX [Psychrobium sp. 1_MG-2023]PKF58074.1 phosphate acyltransferase PlsX [Alteromonadales bacterium alter-6D02]